MKKESSFLEEIVKITGDRNQAEKIMIIWEQRAERERKEREMKQQEGIRKAKERGVPLGRPTKELPQNFKEIYDRYAAGEISAAQAAGECEMSVSSFYRKCKGYY